MRKYYREKLKRYFKVDFDKFLHVISGIGIASIGIILGFPEVGVIGAIILGFLKESIWDDALNRGTVEVQDFLFTSAGALIMFCGYRMIMHDIETFVISCLLLIFGSVFLMKNK